jgi:chromosome segregation ATPase
MAKIAVSIPDSTLRKIDDLSNTKGITRSKYVSMALDFYSNGASNFKNDIDRLNSELAGKTKELESLSGEVLPLREKVHTLSNTVTDKDNQLKEKDREVGTKANEVFQKDKRIHTLENQIAEYQKKIESMSSAVLLAKEEGMKVREELEKARSEATKYEMAFKSQQSDIEFLRGHVGQLTQQINVLALPPSKEEAKKKGWWQFWRD